MKPRGSIFAVFVRQLFRLSSLDLRVSLPSVAALGLCALILSGCASIRAPGRPGSYALDLGPLASVGTDLHGGSRVTALGPLVENRAATNDTRFFALHPFYSRTYQTDRNRTAHEFLWPIATAKDAGQERFVRFLMTYYHDFDRHTAHSRFRLVSFPFLFGGRDAQGKGYFAVFPVGGTIHEFLFRDKIAFGLWPLYTYSTINSQKTHSVLWPIGSYTRGGGVLKYRVLPLYGRSSYKGQWVKKFVLWPFYSSVDYNYPKSKGSGFVLFPLTGHVKLTDQETWMFIPPFFRWTQGGKMDKLNGPWPFIQYSSGAADKLYIWPLWGYRNQEADKSWFCLWPLFWGRETEYAKYNRSMFRLVPLIHYEWDKPRVTNAPPATATRPAACGRYFQLWPLFSYLREDTNSVTRFLDLWPFRRMAPMERNYVPLWTLYSRERAGTATSDELLWGMFRRTKVGGHTEHVSVFPLFSVSRNPAGDSRRFSCLLGLCQYERKGLDRRWRLLYFLRLGGRHENAAAGNGEPSP
jgi:hypothetical protein